MVQALPLLLEITAVDKFLKCAPAASVIFRITRMIVHIEDNGPLNNSGKYDTDLTLATGISVDVHNNYFDGALTNGPLIKTNLDWGRYCYDVSFSDFVSGNNIIQAR